GALKRRLMELGFVPGERVQVLRRVFHGHGPLAVRVGTSTFAMRRMESSLIEVCPT
ncbi:MAG: ferrous iron transport protein, partial [Pseudomonadota bacterium]|nr:ferrous iron transport protein [Pseudomonadota bacterium]